MKNVCEKIIDESAILIAKTKALILATDGADLQHSDVTLKTLGELITL